jgi:hypothetical protein
MAWELPVQRFGARWRGWSLRVVGYWWPDPSPAVLFAADRGWPVVSLAVTVGGVGRAVTTQVRFLRATSPTGAVWLEVQWRPDDQHQRLIPSPYRFADGEALQVYAELVADGVALLRNVAPGRPWLDPAKAKAELYSAWSAHLAEKHERPSEPDLLNRLPWLKSRDALYDRIKVLRWADIPWPPETSDDNAGLD